MKKTLIGLHLLLMFYSIGGYFSKKAASTAFLSTEYIKNYLVVLLILMIYAIFWQLILQKLPLTVAMANKSVTVIWGIVYGVLCFREHITVWNLFGAVLIMAGIVLVTKEEETHQEGQQECT